MNHVLLVEDDPDLRAQAAEWATKCLRQAIAGLTGLKGDTLNEVFRDIRGELHRRGEALALFIEDVSTLSVLDAELVNALQPVNDSSLCPLISVLGLTLGAYAQLPDNLRQRIDKTLELSGSSSFRNTDTASIQVDRFVARYLNALRFGALNIQTLADDVTDRGLISHSACTMCNQREICFAAFGSVDVDNVAVGMYPLSPGTSLRLLNGLNDDRIPKTPRTLLQYIVAPLLRKTAFEWSGRSIGLEIRPKTPIDFSEEEDQLLARWNSEQRSRMSYLVYYWTGEEVLKEAVHSLDPKLAWWGLPQFDSSRRLSIEPPRLATQADTTNRKPIPVADSTPAEFTAALSRLDQWHKQNEPLRNNASYRELLLKAVQMSIQLEEIRSPSNRIQRLARLKSGNIEIEGQDANAAVVTRIRFKFDRSDETYFLIRNLLGFKFKGNNSWDYNHGEVDRRHYGLWLTQNSSRLISSYEFHNSSRDTSINLAVKFLRLAYRLSYRKDLPSDTGLAVEALVSFIPVQNQCLTNDLMRLCDDLPTRVQSIRNELLDELAVRQGDGGILYIDPISIIDNLSGSGSLDLDTVEDLVNKTEFPDIGRLAQSKVWMKVEDALALEQASLIEQINLIYSKLSYWKISNESIESGMESYLKSCRGVIHALESANQSLGNEQLQRQISDLRPAIVTKYVNIFTEAEKIANDRVDSILDFDMKEFVQALTFVLSIDDALIRTKESLTDKLNKVITSSEVETARAAALTAIKEIQSGGSGDLVGDKDAL